MSCDRKYRMLKNLDIKKEMKCAPHTNMRENSYNTLLSPHYICTHKAGRKALHKKQKT